MKKIITAKTFGSALAAILAGSVAGTTIFAYDGNYDYLFTYDNDSVSADTDADGAVDTASYSIDGTVITIAGAGTYVVTGSSEDGSITVEKNSDGVTLIFENLTLTSAEEGTVTVGKNSDTEIVIEGENTLTNTNEDGAVIKIKSGASVTVTGTGELTADASEGKNGIKGASEATLTIGEDESDSFTLTVSAANNGVASDGSVVVNGGTVNIISDGDGLKSSPDEDDTASEGTVTVNNGTINIESAEDGVQADGGFTMNGGTLNIVAGGGAANASNLDEDTSAKGIKSDSYILIADGDITIDSADDGIHLNGTTGDEAITITNGSITIASGDDGIHSDYTLNIGTEGSDEGPDINITNSVEGLEGATVNLYSGTGTVRSSDDGINAANSDLTDYNYQMNISGGVWYINADGDGLDSNGDINVSGGETTVFGAADNGNAALDVGDNNNKLNITGGSIAGIGMSGMSIVPSSGTYVQFGSSGMGGGMGGQPGQPGQMSGAMGGSGQQTASGLSISAGAAIEIKDSDGNTVFSATAVKSADSIVFASDELESGKSYTLYINGSSAATVSASEGNGSTGAMGGGMGGQQGTMPTAPTGQTGQQQGTMPTAPTGEAGQQQGTMPTAPTGEAGQQQGTMPTAPTGQTGQQQGTMPTAPTGEAGQQQGTMPTAPTGEAGQQQGTMPTAPAGQSIQQNVPAPSYIGTDRYSTAETYASVPGYGTVYSSDSAPVITSVSESYAAAALLDHLAKNGGKADFAEIEALFDKIGYIYRGECYIAAGDNLVTWYGWSESAVNMLNRLIVSEKVRIAADESGEAAVPEEVSGIPEADGFGNYTELHRISAVIELCS
ncbi:MAG: carbohydrate-binding domain-containing protein [Ruminiclostridium sp.]|nr:carbohydrate-binding domain-containing protein [Ruminiclostridium sp.]